MLFMFMLSINYTAYRPECKATMPINKFTAIVKLSRAPLKAFIFLCRHRKYLPYMGISLTYRGKYLSNVGIERISRESRIY